jgi:Concanavalin A-like lectin/glucanases superfamily
MCKKLILLASFVLLSGLIGANAAILEARWEFDGDYAAVTETVYDYTGVDHGSVDFVSGQMDLAVRFDGGRSDLVPVDCIDSTHHTAAYEFNEGFSVMGWVNPDELPSGAMILSHDRTRDYETMGFGVAVQPDGRLGLGMKDNTFLGQLGGYCPYDSVLAGQWTHFAVTWNGSTTGGIQVYVNGEFPETTINLENNFAGLNQTGLLPFRVGADHLCSADFYSGFAGSIDHLSIWKGVLTAEEILADYLAGLKTPGDMLADLALYIEAEVVSGNIAAELENGLLAKVGAALAALERGNPNDAKVAMNNLKALINQVEAQTDKKIAPETAAEIIEQASDIIAAVGG